MKRLTVELTDEQYQRYKQAFSKLQNESAEVEDEQLIAQLKREAAAITYAAEVGHGDGANWEF